MLDDVAQERPIIFSVRKRPFPLLRAAFAIPCRVLKSAPAVRRAVLTLVFAAGIVLFGWVLSGQAQASESATDGTAVPVPGIDSPAVTGAVDAIAAPVTEPVTEPAPAPIAAPEGFTAYDPAEALTLPVSENTGGTPSTVLDQAADQAARVSDELRTKGETAFRPIVDRVGRDLPHGFPVKPGTGHTPPASTGASGGAATTDVQAVSAKAAPEATAPQASTQGPAATQSPAPRAEQAHGVRTFAENGTAHLASPGNAPYPSAPTHESTSTDDAVVGSVHRGGAPGGVPVSAAPLVPARIVPMTAASEPAAELIDRTEEVPVSPA